MNTRYTIRRDGTLWEVRRPDGQRVSAYTLSGWHAAIYEAHVLSTADQIRDQKHRELFGPCPGAGLRAFVDRLMGITKRPPRHSDYVLAR